MVGHELAGVALLIEDVVTFFSSVEQLGGKLVSSCLVVKLRLVAWLVVGVGLLLVLV